MTHRLVLSLFPGIGLLDRSFEEAGFQIVRGPDLIWGGDVRRFHINPEVFVGIIGGPPCQVFSTSSKVGPGTKAVDLIGQFVRIVQEGKPSFVVMENVPNAHRSPHVPADWSSIVLRDFDCGGLTARKRRIWTWPFSLTAPTRRDGKPSLSVMASTYKRGKSTNPFVAAKHYLPGDLPIERYGELQGFPSVVAGLTKYNFSRATIIQLLGNGVPHALGRYVASAAKDWCDLIDEQRDPIEAVS